MTVKVNASLVSGKNTGYGSEHGGFSAAVLSDNAEDLAFCHRKRNTSDSVNGLRLGPFQLKQALFYGVGFQEFICNMKIIYVYGNIPAGKIRP